MTRVHRFAILLPFVALLLSAKPAQVQQPAPNPADRFEVSDVMIPMRDGPRLNTKIFVPRNQSGPLPIIVKRTPYGIDGSAGNFNAYFKALADEGYIFVFQDIRGKFKSEGEFVMQRPPRADGRHEVARRRHRHLRHHRVAAEERAQQQRPRRHARHLLRRLDDHHGRARAASGAQGDLAAGLARGHVARRRLPSQRRVPTELRLRVRRDDGERQGRPAVHVRSLRHVRLVSESRAARQRQREVPARQDSDVERLRRASRLRRVLEAPDDGAAPDEREGADAERGGLVGSGGLLRAGAHLRRAREARHRGPELSRRRAVASRRLGAAARATRSARSRSAATPPSTSATRCRRRSSRIT